MPVLPIAMLLLTGAIPAPLRDALEAAQTYNRTLRISRAQLAEQEASVTQALAGLTPTLQIAGSYVHNQYDGVLTYPNYANGTYAGLTTVTVTPYDQIQGTIGLNVPIVAPGAIARYAEQRHGEAGSRASEAASELEVQLSVARAYYQVVAAQGILAAAERALQTAQEALKVSQAQVSAGTANQLTIDRAQVDIARAAQTRANAIQTLGLARRSLETLTGLRVGDLPLAQTDGPQVETEDTLIARAKSLRPEILQSHELLAQASATRDEAWTTLAPTVVGQAQEHLQNYTGFTYHEGYWTLGVNLNWTIDPVGTPGQIKKANATYEEQAARLDQALDTVRDDVHSAWLDVEANRAKVEETQAEVKSAQQALALTQSQFKAGTSSSLDLSQAERDAFTAEANAAQAQSDLATALLALQKASGVSLLEASK